MATFLTHFVCQSHPRRTGESYRFLLLRRRAKKKLSISLVVDEKPKRPIEEFLAVMSSMLFTFQYRAQICGVLKWSFVGDLGQSSERAQAFFLCRVKTNWRLNQSRVVGRSVSGDENKSDSRTERVLFELGSDMSLSRH